MAIKETTLTIRVTKECKETIELIAKHEDRSVSYVANRIMAMGLLEEIARELRDKPRRKK